MSAVLALLLLGQTTDVGFRYAVESSVQSFGTVRTFGQVLPQRQVIILRGMASNRHGTRQASKAVLEADPRAFRAWYWATRSSEREVAAAAEEHIAGLPCQHCGGTWECPKAKGVETSWDIDCDLCRSICFDRDAAYSWDARRLCWLCEVMKPWWEEEFKRKRRLKVVIKQSEVDYAFASYFR